MSFCEICNKEYTNLGVHNRFKHGIEGGKKDENSTSTAISQGKIEETNNVGNVLSSIVNTLQKIDTRLTNLEVKSGKVDESFKRDATSFDVNRAKVTRTGVDEKITKIVDEMLGEDFGIEVSPREGQPGLNFTLLVPRRLSDIKESSRPIKGENGEYLLDSRTKLPIQEVYWPEDRRTRAIANHESYDAIREYCDKVRAYIVTFYQKLNRPIPEFKVRNYV